MDLLQNSSLKVVVLEQEELLPPRTGVAMTVQSQLRGIKRPIAFIPTYLGYEHVSEVGNYMRELNGESKKKRKCLLY